MKRMLETGSKNQEFHAQIYLWLPKCGEINMDMKIAKQHLLAASRSMPIVYFFL